MRLTISLLDGSVRVSGTECNWHILEKRLRSRLCLLDNVKYLIQPASQSRKKKYCVLDCERRDDRRRLTKPPSDRPDEERQ